MEDSGGVCCGVGSQHWDTQVARRASVTYSRPALHLPGGASVVHGRSTNLPRVWRSSSSRYASRTSSRAKTPAIGTSSSPRATRSANSATTAAVAASAPPADWTPNRSTASKIGDGVDPVARDAEVLDRHGDIPTTEEIQQGIDVSRLCCGAQPGRQVVTIVDRDRAMVA